MFSSRQTIKSKNNCINIQLDNVKNSHINLITTSELIKHTHIKRSPTIDFESFSSVKEGINDLIKTNDWSSAIDLVDFACTISERSGKCDPELLLLKSNILQKSGNTQLAICALREYKESGYSRNVNFFVCIGKIISQHYKSPDRLMSCIRMIQKTREVKDNQQKLASLIWRAGILYALNNSSKSTNILSWHYDLSSIGDYQIPHNLQCRAMSTLPQLKSNRERRDGHKIREKLLDAYEAYTNIAGFIYLNKCLLSNLLITAVLEQVTGERNKYCKITLICRKLFKYYDIKPNDEAVSEVLHLVRTVSPHAYLTLYGPLSKSHLDGFLIEPRRIWKYYEIAQHYARMINDGALYVDQLYTQLTA